LVRLSKPVGASTAARTSGTARSKAKNTLTKGNLDNLLFRRTMKILLGERTALRSDKPCLSAVAIRIRDASGSAQRTKKEDVSPSPRALLFRAAPCTECKKQAAATVLTPRRSPCRTGWTKPRPAGPRSDYSEFRKSSSAW